MLVMSIFVFIINSTFICIRVGTGVVMTGRVAFPRVQDRSLCHESVHFIDNDATAHVLDGTARW